MRIVQITQHGTIVGGVETYAADLARLLQQWGHESFLLYGRAPQPIPGSAERKPLAPRSFYSPALTRDFGPWSARAAHLERALKEIAPDGILVHDLEDADLLRMLSRSWPTIPFVHVASRYVCPGRGKFYARERQACSRPFGLYCMIAPYLHACGTRRPGRLLSNWQTTRRWIEVARQMRRVMVASHYMKRELMAVGIPEAHIVVNPPFVELEENAPPMRSARVEDPEDVSRRLRSQEDPGALPIALFCGRLYDYKGAEFLLLALAHVTRPVHAVLIGEGPERPKLEHLARQVPPRHAVSFTGWLARQAVFRWYRRATVLVVPSVWPEPFGRVGPEAMAHGVPVVASRVGAIPEWVREGETGVLVPPGDARALASALERILNDTALARAMSARARRMAAEHFHPERHLRCLMRALTDVAQTP